MKSLESKGYPFVHAIQLVALLKHKDLFNQIFCFFGCKHVLHHHAYLKGNYPVSTQRAVLP